MLDQMHQPPAEMVARAYVDAEGYARMYAASVADPEAFWAEQGKRLDWIDALHPGQEHLVRLARRLDPLVRGRQAQRLGQLRRPPPRRAAATRPRSSGRADDPATPPGTSATASCTPRSAAWPTCSRASASGRATGSSSTCR